MRCTGFFAGLSITGQAQFIIKLIARAFARKNTRRFTFPGYGIPLLPQVLQSYRLDQLASANCVTFYIELKHIWAILIHIGHRLALAMICSLTNSVVLSGRTGSLPICKMTLMRFDLTNCSIARIEHAFSHKPFDQDRHIVLAALFNTDPSRSAKFTSDAELLRA
jgi:hypothetical protein